MTLYMAIDPVTGVSLPDGKIAGIAETVAGLRAQGFGNNPYSTGNRRRPSIDETDSSVWNNDCVPGWHYVGSAVQLGPPQTDLEALKSAFRSFRESIEQLSIKLLERAEAGWHSPELVEKGRSWIYHAGHEAGYMVGLNTTLSNAVKRRFALVGRGIAQAILAENDSETLYNGIEPITAPTGPVLVVNLNTGAQIAFSAAVAITPESGGYPAIPTSANLGGGSWIETIS